jgi:hypothetical protein
VGIPNSHSLSAQLYQKPTHFLLELIQNADDNTYDKAVVPTLAMYYRNRCLVMTCNEVGFSKKNVDSLCGTGISTKAFANSSTHFIGEKGIGFKSVFKVADVVWIKSGHYSFKFDKGLHLGMVAPIWADGASASDFPEEKIHFSTPHNTTTITLQITQRYDDAELVRELKTLDPKLLIFLDKLRRVEISIFDNDWNTSLERIDDARSDFVAPKTILRRGNSSTEFMIADLVMRGLPDEPLRPGCNKCQLRLAFPAQGSRPIVTGQQVYAYVPIRDYGFKVCCRALQMTGGGKFQPRKTGTTNASAVPNSRRFYLDCQSRGY